MKLVAFSAKDIREAIQEAIEKLNIFLEREYMKLNNEADDMVDEIFDLSQN